MTTPTKEPVMTKEEVAEMVDAIKSLYPPHDEWGNKMLALCDTVEELRAKVESMQVRGLELERRDIQTLKYLAEAREEIKRLEVRDASHRHAKLGCCE